MSRPLTMLMTGGLGFAAGAAAVVFVLSLSEPAAGPTSRSAPTPAQPASFADAVERAAPSVLRIFGRRTAAEAVPAPPAPSAFNRAPPVKAPPGLDRGSAVVVSADGLLVTSAHLVAAADAIGVEVPEQGIVDAALVGIDPATDLAVLRLDAPRPPAIDIGHPNRLRVGDVVLAIGNPFGLERTVSLGIVSALGRTRLGLTDIEDFIQTDAAINPGNSGGALIDATGRLVGINTAIMSDSGYSEGVAFVVPADRVMRVVEAIAREGHVARGWIGIGARTLDAELARRFGVRAPAGAFVTRVIQDSPAAAADIRAGDVIVKADEHPIASSPTLREAIIAAGSGREIPLELWRGSERLSTRVRTSLRPATTSFATDAAFTDDCASDPMHRPGKDGC